MAQPETKQPDYEPVSESDVRAARDAAGVTRQAGHADTLALWEASPEGQHFIEVEAPARTKEIEAEHKAAVESGHKQAKAQEAYERSVKQAQETAQRDQAADQAAKAQ